MGKLDMHKNDRGQSKLAALTVLRSQISSTLGHNVLSLYSLQFANYILPLITVPYLVRVLGPERFGAVAFSQGLIAYLTTIVNYGFDWSATRTISVQRHDLKAVTRTASSVWIAKTLLCLGGLFVLILLIQTVNRLKGEAHLLYILFGIVIGNVMFPTWLFQGLERMVFISIINFGMRSLVTVGIFFLVRQPSDFLIYAGLLSLQWIGIGILGVWTAKNHLHIQFERPSLPTVISTLKDGWHLFVSTSAVSLYTVGNTFILGMVTNNIVVGYFSAAEKLVKISYRLMIPLQQAVYPRISKMASHSPQSALRWSKHLLFIVLLGGSMISLFILVATPMLVRILLGVNYEPSILVMRILAPLPLLIGVSNVLCFQIMLPFKKDKAFSFILLTAGVLNLSLAFFFAPLWQEKGMAVSVVTVEVFVVLASGSYLAKEGLLPFGYLLKKVLHIEF